MRDWIAHDGERAFTRHLHLWDYCRLATTLAEAVLFLPFKDATITQPAGRGIRIAWR
jgi:hypothetical protein